jgi:hypothetical protein
MVLNYVFITMCIYVFDNIDAHYLKHRRCDSSYCTIKSTLTGNEKATLMCH